MMERNLMKDPKDRCSKCEAPADVHVTHPLGLSSKLCVEHTPIPEGGDTIETMYDRHFMNEMLEGIDDVCAVSLCGRTHDYRIDGIPYCREHFTYKKER